MFRHKMTKLQKAIASFFDAKTIEEQKQQLARKKCELNDTQAAMLKTIDETRQLTVSLVNKLRHDTLRLRIKLKSTINENVNKSIIFIDYMGKILFINRVALDTFDCLQADAFGHSVRTVVMPMGITDIDVERCSRQIIKEVQACVARDCKDCDALQHLDKCFINSDEQVTLQLSSGAELGPMTAVVTLLDNTPKELSDITYIIYATRSEPIAH